MELIDKSVPARTTFSGDENINISAGKSLKIETSPNGDNYLNTEVPEGKQWSVNIYVQIVETDA